MLSKSQARMFFLGGTFLFSAIFIGLTVDTHRQLPERTHTKDLTEDVVKGKRIWEENNCMGCHTILGEGAYYAPDLTKVVEKRGEEWIRLFMKDPEAMFPNERKMPKYNFSDEQISYLIAFFKWVGKIDTNGWPPKPDIVVQTSVKTNQEISNIPAKFNQVCKACHAIGGNGGNVGPALDHVGAKYDKDYLVKWLKDPQSIKPGTNMPKLPLSEEEIQELAAFLSSLK
jgi:Cytochrome c553